MKKGGARKGAGRPSQGKKATTLSIKPETKAKAKLIGGNASKGVDMAVEAYELLPKQPDATKDQKC